MTTAYGQGHVQGSGGQIQHHAALTEGHVAGQHPAPVLIHAKTEQAVEQIVKTRDAAEHSGHSGIMDAGLAGSRDGSGAHALVPSVSSAFSRMAA